MTIRVNDLEHISQYLTHKTQQQDDFRQHTWRMLWPTPKQSAIFADRSIPKPDTRGEAADQIREIKQREGWDDE